MTLSELRAALNAIPKGDWYADQSHVDTAINSKDRLHILMVNCGLGRMDTDAVATFVVFARNHFGALLDVCEAAKEFYDSDEVMVIEHWEKDGRTRIEIPAEEKLKAALRRLEDKSGG